MESENALLKEEITRLQYLNRILTDRLMRLETDLSPSQKTQGDNDTSLSPYQNQQSDVQLTTSPSQNNQSDIVLTTSPSQNKQSDNYISISPPQNEQGDKAYYLSPSKNKQGDNKTFISPYKSLDDAALLRTLYTRLYVQGMKGVRLKTIRNTASALLYLSRGGALDYHYVVKNYGYTARSATKFIIALQTWGWAARQPGARPLLLTQKGRGVFPEGYLAP